MIIFDHVSKVYPNGTVGLDDVDLTIQDGEFVAIIGRSGAGKSTLLRSVNRMHQITSGTLTVNGTDVSTLSGKSLRRFRRGIGMVFQSFNLVTRTTVIKNVLSACVPDMPFWRVLLGAFRKADKIKALESLDKVGILDKAYIRADQLSGGQQQRVAIARALALHPDILCFDEPTSALDPELTGEVLRVLRDLADRKTTMIIVTHEMHFARDVAELGVDGFMCVVPYYNKPPQEGMYRHFRTIADAVELPIILYNIPGRCSINMEGDTTLRLAHNCDNVVAIKEASGNFEQIKYIIDNAPAGFDVYSGDDSSTLDIMELGGVGVISTIGNVSPARMKEIVELAAAGDWEAAEAANERLMPLMTGLFETSNPILVKEALKLLGVIKEK